MSAQLPFALRRRLDQVATPVEPLGPVAACVTTVDGQWRTAWMHDGGRRKAAFGEPYPTAILAAAACHYLNERAFGSTE